MSSLLAVTMTGDLEDWLGREVDPAIMYDHPTVAALAGVLGRPGNVMTDTAELPGASAEAIDFHYSVGNAFYRLWLDESLTYSGALWDGDETLEAAQRRKLDYHFDQAGVAEGMRVLDIGCGWGSGLRRMTAERGVAQAVGLTLSQAQADWLGTQPSPKIEVRIESWQDHSPPQPYDAIISIGAFEHFAKANLPRADKVAAYREFFHRCHGLLRKGGRLSLQTIAYGNIAPDNRSAFVEKQIFPESDLPTLGDSCGREPRRLRNHRVP